MGRVEDINVITDLIEKIARSIPHDEDRNLENITYFLKGRERNIDIGFVLEKKGFRKFRTKGVRYWKLPK